MNHKKATPATGTRFSASAIVLLSAASQISRLQRIGRNGTSQQPEDRKHEEAGYGGGFWSSQVRVRKQ